MVMPGTDSPSALIRSTATQPIPGSPASWAPLPFRSSKTVPETVPLGMSPKVAVAELLLPAIVMETSLAVVLTKPSGSVSLIV